MLPSAANFIFARHPEHDAAALAARLREVDLHIPAGQFVAVVGRSGCGKSTLLRLLAGLDKPTAGELLAGSAALSEAIEDTRLMFQEARLLPWKKVIDNVGLGLKGDWRDRKSTRLNSSHVF